MILSGNSGFECISVRYSSLDTENTSILPIKQTLSKANILLQAKNIIISMIISFTNRSLIRLVTKIKIFKFIQKNEFFISKTTNLYLFFRKPTPTLLALNKFIILCILLLLRFTWDWEKHTEKIKCLMGNLCVHDNWVREIIGNFVLGNFN